MSEHDVELHRRWIEAFNARDIEAQISYLDPSIEYQPTFAAADGTAYHGHDGFRRWHRARWETWDQFRTDPEAYFDLGEQILMFAAFHARGRGSGVEVAMPMAQVSRWREGRMVYAKGYADRADALRDLGVTEDDLKRIDP